MVSALLLLRASLLDLLLEQLLLKSHRVRKVGRRCVHDLRIAIVQVAVFCAGPLAVSPLLLLVLLVLLLLLLLFILLLLLVVVVWDRRRRLRGWRR